MLIALLAALTMLVSDVLSVMMVQAEAANRGWLAGILDAFSWLVWISTTTISVATLSGHHSFGSKALVVGFVTAANILGTKLGQVTGQWLMARTGWKSTEDRVRDLEVVVATLRPTTRDD